MDGLSEETIPPFSCVASLVNRDQLSRKEFAPPGANSFLEEWSPFGRAASFIEQTGIHVVSFCKADRKH